MNLLLDTCTFLWVVSGAPELSASAKRAFSDPANSIFLSSVSVWEISVKYALGKLPLPDKPSSFIPQQREAHGIEKLALEEEAILQLGKLPDFHKDPFDRMLVGQAIAFGYALLTPDPLITQYPIRTVW